MRTKRPTLAEVVADGLYIAAAATRLALKNHILVEALARDEDFDVERLVPEARAILEGLAAEADADAERASRERKIARGRFSVSDGTHDYRSRDVRNLRRRERQATQVAAALRARAEDPAELRQLVHAAREAAWAELSRTIDESLRIASARPDLEPDYERLRLGRMQSLRLVDLPELAAQRRRAPSDPADAADSSRDDA
ncbi:asparagine synthase [Microbacterium sp. X-17]|uniref:asparagine synthase n=1 Tax=Microbacterium sp. X-17 TaxID=3144404 RepID=UPI0031F4F5D2